MMFNLVHDDDTRRCENLVVEIRNSLRSDFTLILPFFTEFASCEC